MSPARRAALDGRKTDDYVDSLYNDYNFEDKHYALPFSRSTPLFYYNKDLWKAAGLEDRGPKDWDEFLTWAPKLKAAAGSDKIVMELPDGSNYLDWVFQNMVWGYGGAYSKEWTPTFSDPNTVKAGHLPAEPRQERLPQALEGPGGRLQGRHRRLQHRCRPARSAASPRRRSSRSARRSCPVTATAPPAARASAIPANISDERKKNALKFIEFLTNAQNTVTFTQATGYMPVRKSAVDLPAEKAFLEKNPNAKTAIEQLPKTRSQDNARVLLPGGGARIGKGLDQIVQGQDVATASRASTPRASRSSTRRSRASSSPWQPCTSTRRHGLLGRPAPAVDGITLDIADGEFLVLVGPSGCGKSTTLRMLAGLEPIDGGRILVDGHDQKGVRPRDRDIAMVFQSYALYPNMTAAQNMAFALDNAKVSKSETKQRVTEAAKILELEQLLDRKPGPMSGGQRQRVAMGRAIVRNPKVFCMDEPLSNLDAKLRGVHPLADRRAGAAARRSANG